MKNELLEQQLQLLPEKPGVYIFKGSDNRVIYVGKAASLRQRVRSYFQHSSDLSPKIQRMLELVEDLEYLVTDSEQEALIVECNLIKRHRPNFNVRLKDDKTYPYLKVENTDGWPRIYTTRRLVQDGSQYFGPFTSAASVRQTLNLLRKIFPFRTCSMKIDGRAKRPCLYYFLHQCRAPCTGEITSDEYAGLVKQVIQFLEGKQEAVMKELKRAMGRAALNLEFEKAARIRDQIKAIEKVITEQRISSVRMKDQDITAIASETNFAVAQVFFIRSGKLIGREYFVIEGVQEEGREEILTGFVKQFYSNAPRIPRQIVVEYLPREVDELEHWLSEKGGNRVVFHIPVRGIGRRILKMALENAKQSLEQARLKALSRPEASALGLSELKEKLSLAAEPKRIEGYDISNIQGNMAVGSMVVFEGGIPKPKFYRRFSIKTVAGADDYAMLKEVLSRRFKRAMGASRADKDENWGLLPDLVLVDGGKGQLNAALEALRVCGVESLQVISLAKEEEQVFVPDSSAPLILPRSSPGLHLLQQVRDEAHRFALGYHRLRRKKETITSALDSIPGVGAKRKRVLLRTFGSVSRIKEADISEIASVEGMNPKLAERVKSFLSLSG